MHGERVVPQVFGESERGGKYLALPNIPPGNRWHRLLQPSNEKPSIHVEREIARHELGNDMFRGESGESKINRSPRRQCIEMVPAKTARPVPLPGGVFTFLNFQVRDMHLKGILIFGEQQHSPAA